MATKAPPKMHNEPIDKQIEMIRRCLGNILAISIEPKEDKSK